MHLSKSLRRKNRKLKAQKAKKLQKKDLQGILIIASIIAAAGLLAVYGYTASKNQVTFDHASCPTNRSLQSNTIYFIDGTDQLSAAAIRYLKRDISRHADEMPQFGKLTVLKLGGNADSLELTELFSACNRGKGEDFNPLTVNQTRQDALREEEFVGPLADSIKALGELEEGARSPIIEALREIGRRDDMTGDFPKSLVIVSDMMHYTQDFSHYQPGFSFRNFDQRSAFPVAANLADVDVHVLYVMRRRISGLQNEQHREFWTDYFNASGATVSFERP